MEQTAKSLARDVMLNHLFCFPDHMDGERCELQDKLGTIDSIVFASFQRLELEIVETLKKAMDAERDRMLYAVRDVAGVEVALKVQLATAPER